MGAGKTLGMTVLGISFAKSMKVGLSANFTLKGISFEKIDSFNALLEKRTGVVLLDEFWQDVDSRRFAQNVDFTHWINQTRKKDLIVFYTTQDFGQVDKRLRRATHWLVFVERRGKGGSMTFVRVLDGRIGKRLSIDDYSKFYELYDTYEIVDCLSIS